MFKETEKKSDLKEISVSAPCRIDMGGTLDISTFYYPLRHLSPCTFNIAVNLRTGVKISSWNKGMVKVSSKGFESAEYMLDEVPFSHPLGLMFAIAAYFRAGGVHIEIDSSSPPRSALGGSSSAAVALVAGFFKLFGLLGKGVPRQKSVVLAHALEQSVAGVPCGLQDQLAAAYGGVNAWLWPCDIKAPLYKKKIVVSKSRYKEIEKRVILAYCGIPHESKNINTKWVLSFLSGKSRKQWQEIIFCTREFVEAVSAFNFKDAVKLMNREMAVRKKMTPDVLDDMGETLVDMAVKNSCGARFTGAGGGGCIWALGEIEDIDRLRIIWKDALSGRMDASLLDFKVDSDGILFHA